MILNEKNVGIARLPKKCIRVAKRVLGKLFDEVVKLIAVHLLKWLLDTLCYKFARLFLAGYYKRKLRQL